MDAKQRSKALRAAAKFTFWIERSAARQKQPYVVSALPKEELLQRHKAYVLKVAVALIPFAMGVGVLWARFIL